MLVIRPSASHIWMHCPGSVAMQHGLPEGEPHPRTVLGSAAHKLAEKWLISGEKPAMPDAETDEGVTLYVEYARRLVVPDLWRRGIEVTHKCDMIHPAVSGTPDLVFLSDLAGRAHILDFKFGFGVVEVKDNPQFLCYAAGIIGAYNFVKEVIIHVVQPFAWHCEGPIRSVRMTRQEVMEALVPLQVAAAEALGPDPQTRTGKHCRYCKAKGKCIALSRATYDAIDFAAESYRTQLSPTDKALELIRIHDALRVLDYRKTGLEADIMASGEQVPGWSVESAPGRLEWSVPAAMVRTIAEAQGVKVDKEPDLITPTQAKKLLGDDIVANLAKRGTGARKLVRVDAEAISNIFQGV